MRLLVYWVRIILFVCNMNDSVDRSLILPDEYLHIVSPMLIKVGRVQKLVILLSVITILLLVGTLYFAFAPVAPQEVLDENKILKQLNSQLKAKKNQLVQTLAQKKGLNSKLVVQNQSLSSQLQQNNDLIAYLQKDIQLNCNPEKQRLRFNMTSMDAFTLSVLNTGSLGSIPEITFLNASGDQLSSFSGNSLPSLEYVDLTDNPITKISNNKLDKLVNLIGVTEQLLLNQFTSNYMPTIKSLNLSHNNISVFKDNTISGVRNLDISDNKLTTFSSYNLGNLENLNISMNPITEFSMNNFTNLVEFSSLFLAGPANGILFNDSYFGKVKSMQLKSKSTSYPPPYFNFHNNYFPSLTNLTLNYFTLSYQSLNTNRMAELADIKFYSCTFTADIQYIQEWSSLLSLQYLLSSFKSFSGHSYPKMTSLHINQSDVREFTNNNFPALQELILSDRYTQIVLTFSNNTFNSLKTLLFAVPTNSDMLWLKSLHKLQYLELVDIKVDNFDSYEMPQLQTLKLTANNITSFKNNRFPHLKNLAISCQLLQFDVVPFQGQLETLQIYGPMQTFENYSFPKLKHLQLYPLNCTFTNNSFPVLQQLQIQNIDFTDSNYLPALKKFFFLGSNIPFTFPHKYQNNIETILLLFTHVHSFQNYTMPNLKQMRITRSTLTSFIRNKLPKATVIYLDSNQIKEFECGGFPGVEYIDLSQNYLDDNIVKTLIECKFTDLIALKLENNRINDVEGARKKLINAYPMATIVL